MAINVQKYIKNMGKSVVYTASDVLSNKFDYVNEFKDTNKEVFKEAYSSIKDYRTTINRIKVAITNNKLMDAAKVGMESIKYSLQSGDFYGKQKEEEIMAKYSGMDFDFDMDDEDFDWNDNDDISDGDKVIATAIKKNNKISAAITSEAIVATSQAQIDANRDNTILLYTQTEKMISKLSGGLDNITSFLKQSGERNDKIQQKQIENQNKFMSNIENSMNKITSQLEELVQIQRNVYNPQKQEENSKRVTYKNLVSNAGVLDIKEYGKLLGKNAFNAINDQFGGGLGMLFGESMGKGGNMIAQFAATPFRSLMEAGINKALGKKFDDAAKDLNETLTGIVPAILSKLNYAGKNESGLSQLIGKIFGIKLHNGDSEINTSKYNKGAVPFDGITKRAITDVIPYYLRKMTSYMTGGPEEYYDYQSGTWKNMNTLHKEYNNLMTSTRTKGAGVLESILSRAAGRSLNDVFENKRDVDKLRDILQEIASDMVSNGATATLANANSDYFGYKKEVANMLKEALKNKQYEEKRVEKNGKVKTKLGRATGRGKSDIIQLDKTFIDIKQSMLDTITSINNSTTENMLRLIAAEGLGNKKDYSGSGFIDKYGDMQLQKSPMAQAIVHAKDDYGYSIYDYLRHIKLDLGEIQYNTSLIPATDKYNIKLKIDDIPVIGSIFPDKVRKKKRGTDTVSNPANNESSSTRFKDYSMEGIREGKSSDRFKRYRTDKGRFTSNDNSHKDEISHNERIQKLREKKRENKGGYSYFATGLKYNSENEDDIGFKRIISEEDSRLWNEEYEKSLQRKEDKNKFIKRLYDSKLIEKQDYDAMLKMDFDTDKKLGENMEQAKSWKQKFYVFSQWVSNKLSSPREAVTESLIKVDHYLQKMIFGNDLNTNEDAEKKSLADIIKDGFSKGFDKIKNIVSDKFDEIKEKISPKLKKITDPIKNFIFGKREDSEGEWQDGLLSGFLNSFKRALDDNSKIVADYVKREKEKLKEKLKTEESEDDDSSSSYTSTTTYTPYRPPSSLGQKVPMNERYTKIRDQYIGKIGRERYNRDLRTDRAGGPNVFSRYNRTLEGIRNAENIEEAFPVMPTFSPDTTFIGPLSRSQEQERRKTIKNNYRSFYREQRIFTKQNKHHETLRNIETERSSLTAELNNINRDISLITDQEKINKRNPTFLAQLATQKKPLLDRRDEILRRLEELKASEEEINNYNDLAMGRVGRIRRLASGGINKTGKPILSAVSSGEYINGEMVPPGGPYITSIPAGATVINPASKSTQAKQLIQEKSLVNKIKTNANTNNGLIAGKISQDNMDLAANASVRGLAGGALGLLAGIPGIGLLIGASTAFANKSNAISDALFGKAIEVDENGNVQDRDNTGIISREIQKAAPDAAKFGLVGGLAGLITPLGPVGGLIAGAAVGFAKNSSLIQEELFGENGVIGKEKIDKLKKALPNMGIGAAAGAFLGPFGLVGNAILGATAGYVTSTNKFKEAIFGKEVTYKDENGNDVTKKEGGLVGAIKKGAEPLKNFGRTMIDSIMDATFGVKDKNGKRQGGLFGTVKDLIVKPIIEGVKPILQAGKNAINSIKRTTNDIITKFKKAASGKDFLGQVLGVASKIGSGAVKVGKAGMMIPLSPFMLAAQGVKGIGNQIRKKQIRKGTASDMTANQRIKFRGKKGMGIGDDFADFDRLLADYGGDTESIENLEMLRDRISYTVDGADAKNQREIDLYSSLGNMFGKYLDPKDRKKLIESFKDGDYNYLEKSILSSSFRGKGKNITQAQREDLLRKVKEARKEKTNLSDHFEKVKNKGSFTKEQLESMGLGDIDLTNKADVEKVKKYFDMEIAHRKAGLTEEDLNDQKQREMWADKNNPINIVGETVKTGFDSVVEQLKIGNKLEKEKQEREEIGRGYDALPDEEKAKYKSRGEYINQEISRIREEEKKSDTSSPTPKPASTNGSVAKSYESKVGSFYNEKMAIMADEAANIFYNLVFENPRNKEAISEYITYLSQMFGENNLPNRSSMNISINYGKNYFDDFELYFDENGTPILDGEGGYASACSNFVDYYLSLRMPKSEVKKSKGKIGKLLHSINKKITKKSLLKFAATAAILTTISPVGGIGLAYYGAKGVKALSDKFGITDKLKNGTRRLGKSIKHSLGSHELDMTSKRNKRLHAKYEKEYANLSPEEAEKYTSKEDYVNQRFDKQMTGKGVLGFAKSGVKNIISGAKNAVDSVKQKAKEQDTFINKFFKAYDKHVLDKEKRKETGEDSPFKKFLKKLFGTALLVGGVPILTGFMKEVFVPIIKDKLTPWFKETLIPGLIGVKNPNTGDYEGGLISGIVNPIRDFFADKFKIVHDWFTNEGKFNNEYSGMKGMINNLKGAGKYAIDLWKSGASTILTEFLPNAVETIIANSWDIAKNLLKGILNGIKGLAKNIISGKDDFDGSNAVAALDYPNNTSSTSSGNGYTADGNYGFNSTTGKVYNVASPTTAIGSVKPLFNFGNNNGSTVNVKKADDLSNIGDEGLNTYNIAKQTIMAATNGNNNIFKKGFRAAGKFVGGTGRLLSSALKRFSIPGKIAAKPIEKISNLGEFILSGGTSDHALVSNLKDIKKNTIKNAGKQAKSSAWNNVSEYIKKAYPDRIKAGEAVEDILESIDDPKELENIKNIANSASTKRATTIAGDAIESANSKSMTKIVNKIKDSRVGKALSKVTSGISGKYNKLNDLIWDKVKDTKAGKMITERISKKLEKEAAGSIKDKFIKKAKEWVSGVFQKIFSSKQFKNVIKESKEALSKESIEKLAKKQAEKVAKEMTEDAIKNGTKGAAKGAVTTAMAGVPIVGWIIDGIFIVTDFVTGMANWRNILQVNEEKGDFGDKILAGLSKALTNIPGIGIFLSEQTIATILIHTIGKVLFPKKSEELIKEREEAQKKLAEYNAAHNTNLSLEEFNNKNKKTSNWYTRLGGNIKDFGTDLFGGDSDVRHDLEETRFVASASKKIEKIRKYGESIVGRLWSHYDKKYLLDFTDKETFTKLCSEVLDKIVTLLNGLTEDQLEAVEDSVTKIDGKAWIFGGNAWKDGYKDAINYLGLPEDTKETKLIKVVAGLASVFIKSFGGAGLKPKIMSIVVTVIGSAFATEEDEVMQKMIDESEENIVDVNQAYQESYDNTILLRNQLASGETNNENIATNANTNDKLSPLSIFSRAGNNIKSFAKDPLGNIKSSMESVASSLKTFINDPFGTIKGLLTNGVNNVKNIASNVKDIASNGKNNILEFFGKLFDKSIGGVTGGLENVSDLFTSLSKRNSKINDSIDNLSLLPNDKKYWQIELDEKNPFASGLYKFTESMNRVVKAPFALAAASLGSGLDSIASTTSDTSSTSSSQQQGNTSTGTNNATTNTTTTTTSTKNNSFISKVVTGAKSIVKKLGSLVFGKGKDEEDDNDDTGLGNDPYHIYQRDYHGSYNTAEDTENQTVADSGCGPAAAASLLRMYGKQGNMNNAVNYALRNKYKEVNGGTYPQYFRDYLGKNGIKTNSNANNKDVVNSLVHNKPVILMGKDSNNSGKTPYGSKYSHYVVARGLDSKGNVIVEDSEDKKGSTRYSLAETLKNSSVRITTGRGKYGRAKQSIVERFIGGVNSVVGSAVTSIIGNAYKAAGVTRVSSNNQQANNTVNASTNGVTGVLTLDTDVKTSCGYTADQLKEAIAKIHSNCAALNYPEQALAAEQKTGINALFCISVAIYEQGWDGIEGKGGPINTTGANWGNYNIFNIEGPNTSNGRWRDYSSYEEAFEGFGQLIGGSGYYGAGLTTIGTIAPRYCPPGDTWGPGVCGVAKMITDGIPNSGSGRGKNIIPIPTSKFMTNVNNVISYGVNRAVNSAVSGVIGNATASTNNTGSVQSGNVNVNIDSETSIICGDSITYGLSYTSLGSRAMGLSSGTTDKNQTTPAGSYSSVFESKKDIIAKATDAIFFWGMNEVHTNMSTDEYFARYQDSIDTILGYAGKNTSNTNVYIMSVIWVPENSGYGGSYSAKDVEDFNNKYLKPFATSKGYPYIDIYEDSKQVPHEAGNVHPSDYNKLYEIIKKHMGGSGSGIFGRAKKNTKTTNQAALDRQAAYKYQSNLGKKTTTSNNKKSTTTTAPKTSSSKTTNTTTKSNWSGVYNDYKKNKNKVTTVPTTTTAPTTTNKNYYTVTTKTSGVTTSPYNSKNKYTTKVVSSPNKSSNTTKTTTVKTKSNGLFSPITNSKNKNVTKVASIPNRSSNTTKTTTKKSTNAKLYSKSTHYNDLDYIKNAFAVDTSKADKEYEWQVKKYGKPKDSTTTTTKAPLETSTNKQSNGLFSPLTFGSENSKLFSPLNIRYTRSSNGLFSPLTTTNSVKSSSQSAIDRQKAYEYQSNLTTKKKSNTNSSDDDYDNTSSTSSYSGSTSSSSSTSSGSISSGNTSSTASTIISESKENDKLSDDSKINSSEDGTINVNVAGTNIHAKRNEFISASALSLFIIGLYPSSDYVINAKLMLQYCGNDLSLSSDWQLINGTESSLEELQLGDIVVTSDGQVITVVGMDLDGNIIGIEAYNIDYSNLQDFKLDNIYKFALDYEYDPDLAVAKLESYEIGGLRYITKSFKINNIIRFVIPSDINNIKPFNNVSSITESFTEDKDNELTNAILEKIKGYTVGVSSSNNTGDIYSKRTGKSIGMSIPDPNAGFGRGKGSSKSKPITSKITKYTSKIGQNNYNFGRGIWGRDGEENTTNTTTDTTQNNNSTQTTINNTSTSTNATDTTETNNTDTENTDDTNTTTTASTTGKKATGLISLLRNYTRDLSRSIYGEFYDALYGDEQVASVADENLQGATDISDPGDTEGRMKAIFSLMVGNGFSKNLAAGIMGNIRAESGYDPHVVEGGTSGNITTDMGHGYGLIQWTGANSRAALYNWCTANNCDPESLDGQTKWVIAQIKGTNIESATNSANSSKFSGNDGHGSMSYNYQLIQGGANFGNWHGGTFDDINKLSVEGAVDLFLCCVERPGAGSYSSQMQLRTKYANEALSLCAGSGSGRGKGLISKTTRSNNKLSNTNNNRTPYYKPYVSKFGKGKINKRKYGRGIWGRDGEEDTTNTTTDTNQTADSSDTTTAEDTNTDTNEEETNSTTTSTTTSSSNSNAKSLLSQISDYAVRSTKSVYGEFYDALYGEEEQATVNGSNGSYANGSGPIYAAAMVFEAMGKANPDHTYCFCCVPDYLYDITCRDGTKLEKIRADCSGMMSAVVQYMGYYTKYGGETYTDTYRGPGYNVTSFTSGNQANIYDKDGNRSPDWVVMDFDPNDRQPGDMIIRNGQGHIDMYVFTDTNGRVRGFNAGSGSGTRGGHSDSLGTGLDDSDELAKYYLDHNNTLPPNDGSIGATTISDGEAYKVIRYIGSGSTSTTTNTTDTTTGSGKYGKGKKIELERRLFSGDPGDPGNSSKIKHKSTSKNKNTSGRGNVHSLPTLSNYTKTVLSRHNNTNTANYNKTTTGYGYSNSNTSSTTQTYTNPNTISLDTFVRLLTVIADNSDKTDSIVQLLTTIATNTEINQNSTNNTSTRKPSNNNSTTNNNYSNGLSGLSQLLNPSNNGQDIMEAVYQIAKR